MLLFEKALSYLPLLIQCLLIPLVLLDNKYSKSSISWIFFILLFPIPGFILYCLSGLNRKRIRLFQYIPEYTFKKAFPAPGEIQKDKLRDFLQKHESFPLVRKLYSSVQTANSSPLSHENQIRLLTSGEEFRESLKRDLEQARKKIFMEFYIWSSDRFGEELKEILIRKRKEGVDIKIISDAVGCLGRLSRKYYKELKAAGIKYRLFFKLSHPVSYLNLNYRNHRKITVIDGRIGYIGGMNIGQEYIDGGRFGHWKDIQLRIHGGLGSSLQTLFATDWFNSSLRKFSFRNLLKNREPLPESFRPPRTLRPPLSVPEPAPAPADTRATPARNRRYTASGVPAQLVFSGPDAPWDTIKHVFLTFLGNAREEILIQSPYYIPPPEIQEALINASLNGLKITLMTAGIPDYKIPFWIAQTYYESILKAGIRVFQYKKGYLHSKICIVDRRLALTGSCNLDVRSFEHNYEAGVLLYNRELARKLADDFALDLKDSRELLTEDLKKINFPRRMRNSFFRIFSPIY